SNYSSISFYIFHYNRSQSQNSIISNLTLISNSCSSNMTIVSYDDTTADMSRHCYHCIFSHYTIMCDMNHCIKFCTLFYYCIVYSSSINTGIVPNMNIIFYCNSTIVLQHSSTSILICKWIKSSFSYNNTRINRAISSNCCTVFYYHIMMYNSIISNPYMIFYNGSTSDCDIFAQLSSRRNI